jgi:hypothetical protein
MHEHVGLNEIEDMHTLINFTDKMTGSVDRSQENSERYEDLEDEHD